MVFRQHFFAQCLWLLTQYRTFYRVQRTRKQLLGAKPHLTCHDPCTERKRQPNGRGKCGKDTGGKLGNPGLSPKHRHGHTGVQWTRRGQDIIAGHAARLFVFRVRFLPYFQSSPFTHTHIHRCRRPGSRKSFFCSFNP